MKKTRGQKSHATVPLTQWKKQKPKKGPGCLEKKTEAKISWHFIISVATFGDSDVGKSFFFYLNSSAKNH